MGHGAGLWSLGGLPDLLVWDREGCIHAGSGRPTDIYAAFCGQAKGAVDRLQGFMETNFEPGRRFANELDFQVAAAN